MGSWSVYCGVGQISITDGKKCVLLPLKKTRLGEYLPYMPATLPIFGTYGDYGDITEIEENENTKLIEEYFNCSIDEFCSYLTRKDKIENVKNELKDMKYMFIDRQVYDFMSSNVGNEYGGKGYLDFGDEGLLKLLGFEFVGKSKKERYDQEWKFGDESFYSDGTWLNTKDGNSIYYFNDPDKYSQESSLVKYANLPEDKMWIGEKSMWQLWKYLDADKRIEKLSWVMDVSHSNYRFEKMMSKYKDDDDYKELIDPKSIAHLYINNIDTFGDGLAELVTMRHNLHCMSGYFAPYILYLTPQCGEFKQHQTLLDKFAEINKSYINEEED